MFLEEKAEGERQEREWPTWEKHIKEPTVYSWVGERYVVLPQENDD